MEKLLNGLKTGKKEEVAAFLSELRNLNDAIDTPGGSQLFSSLNGKTLDTPIEEAPSFDIHPLNGDTKSPLLAAHNVKDGTLPTLTDELAQVMSQLDVDEGGKVRYLGPSSNLNLVSDDPHIPAPSLERDARDRSASISSGSLFENLDHNGAFYQGDGSNDYQ